MSRAFLLLLAGVLVPGALPAPRALALPAGDRKVDLPAVVKSLSAYMKKKELGKRDPEDIAKRIAGLGEEDLAWVLERLREVPEKDRGAAGAQVEKSVEDALLSARYSPAVLRIPEVAKRLADTAPAARCALMADLSRLEDAEPATRFCLWALSGGADAVRLRAIDVLADLVSWGGDPARILPALEKALADPSAAVRDLALERLAAVCHPAALDWSIEHLAEPAEETAAVREVQDRRCPGERALDIATRAAKLHFGMSAEEFRALPEADRDAVRAELRAWRGKAGSNPLRDGDEGRFDPVPKVVSAVVDPLKDPRATVRWWSDVDRAQFRLDLDEMDVAASTKSDWFANFRLTVIASGARQGNWESFARKLRCGVRHRLPRKGFGLVETTVQPLLDGKWKVWVRCYEWKGG
jgi:hypothetical protein